MECKVMTEEQMQEIQKLYDDGYGKALDAFGLECVNAACVGFCEGFCKSYSRAYNQNVLKGAAMTTATVLVIGAIVYKVKQKKSENQKEIEE